MEFNLFKCITGGITGILTFLFGGFDLILSILVSLVVVDYITGILAAIYNKELSSEVGYKGIIKKVGIIVIIALAHLAGQAAEIDWIRGAVIGFFIANEGISILENVGRTGVKYPKKLLDLLKQLQDNDDTGGGTYGNS